MICLEQVGGEILEFFFFLFFVLLFFFLSRKAVAQHSGTQVLCNNNSKTTTPPPPPPPPTTTTHMHTKCRVAMLLVLPVVRVSPPESLTHSLTHSPTNSLTHSPTNSLTHSLTHIERGEPALQGDTREVEGLDVLPDLEHHVVERHALLLAPQALDHLMRFGLTQFLW